MPSAASGLMETVPRILCRQEQTKMLLSLFGSPDQVTVPSIFIYGHNATGKTLVLKSIFYSQELPHVFVNCVECYTARLLYQRLLNEVAQHVPSTDNDFTCYAKCDNMNDFVRLFKQLRRERKQYKTVYFVFQKAQRLRDMDANLLPALLRLQELTNDNVCVIFESEIAWKHFLSGNDSLQPFPLHFPAYSKDELLEIMCSSPMGTNYPPDMMSSYYNLVISTFHMACANLRELQHMAQLNFPKFLEPINRGDAKPEDIRKLWRNVEPHLKRALQTLYLREVSSSQWERMQKESSEDSKIPMQGLSSRVAMELPYYSKFLLLAAYLASYNPSKCDRRFFSKNAGRINKRTVLNVNKKSEKTSSQLLGPKSFPLDRVMAIFYSIVEEKVSPSICIYSQITSLVNLGLLARITGSDSLESPKFKCLVTLDMIRLVAKNVGFDVIRYLYDYVG